MESDRRKYKARIVGGVSLHDEEGKRINIPAGDCEIIEEDVVGPFRVVWRDGSGEKSAALNLRDWVIHTRSGAIKVCA